MSIPRSLHIKHEEKINTEFDEFSSELKSVGDVEKYVSFISYYNIGFGKECANFKVMLGKGKEHFTCRECELELCCSCSIMINHSHIMYYLPNNADPEVLNGKGIK
jgi:hypothetical protein